MAIELSRNHCQDVGDRRHVGIDVLSGRKGLAPDIRSRRAGQSGFTLMEIIVAMVLVLALVSIAMPYVGSALGVQVKSTARQLAGTMRFLYDEAGIKSTNFRMVFNLDRHSYKIEQCDASADDQLGSPLLYHSADEREKGLEALAEKQRRMEDYATAGSAPVDPDPLQRCKAYSTEQVSEMTFEEPVTLLGIWTPQYKGVMRGNPDGPPEKPEDDLTVDVYFLKGGYAERAYIYLSDGGEEVYTLELEPLTGKVNLYDGEVEVPREFWR